MEYEASERRPGTARIRQTLALPILDGLASAQIITFDGLSDRQEHIALRFVAPRHDDVPIVRLHSECLTGDVFGSQRCDCGPQLREALHWLRIEGGVLLYLRQEGRGIGLYSKLDSYALQFAGLDTFAANRQLNFADDLRDYRSAAQMLHALGIRRIRLLTNNPDKVRQLELSGIDVVERISTSVFVNQHNSAYLSAKAQHAKHFIRLVEWYDAAASTGSAMAQAIAAPPSR